MVLSAEEARVVACLVEKEATVPDSYPLTLNALRLACNQTTNRDPIVAYDDRTVENALLSLKSMGLVRFVHPSHGGRTIRYRHVADERWRLSTAELGGAGRARAARPADRPARCAARAERHDRRRRRHRRGDPRHAGGPQPGAVRRPRRAAPRRARGRAGPHALSGRAGRSTRRRRHRARSHRRRRGRGAGIGAEPRRRAAPNADLARDVAELWLRVERLERLLGLAEDLSS